MHKIIDIGANLTDPMFSGVYNGSNKHEPDLKQVLSRAKSVGVEKVIITAGNLEEVKNTSALVKCYLGNQEVPELYSTVGVHPTRCTEFNEKPDEYMQNLKDVFSANRCRIVALGECGLDYERTQFCDIDTQKKYFEYQLEELGEFTKLPLFLHCRGAASDLLSILEKKREVIGKSGGVIHSFDGNIEEMQSFINFGFQIGVNGCSLKTEENLEVLRAIPAEKLLLETDAPWCGIRPSHASSKYVITKFGTAKKNYDPSLMYKARNEPQTILNVLEVVAAVKDMDIAVLAQQVFQNTMNLYFPEQ